MRFHGSLTRLAVQDHTADLAAHYKIVTSLGCACSLDYIFLLSLTRLMADRIQREPEGLYRECGIIKASGSVFKVSGTDTCRDLFFVCNTYCLSLYLIAT